jgi:hypothetical protein
MLEAGFPPIFGCKATVCSHYMKDIQPYCIRIYRLGGQGGTTLRKALGGMSLCKTGVYLVGKRGGNGTITAIHLEVTGTVGHRPSSVEMIHMILANKEVSTMDMSLTIEEFNALLTSEKDDSPLLAALRKLTAIQEPEDITKLAADPLQSWWAWNAV